MKNFKNILNAQDPKRMIVFQVLVANGLLRVRRYDVKKDRLVEKIIMIIVKMWRYTCNEGYEDAWAAQAGHVVR